MESVTLLISERNVSRKVAIKQDIITSSSIHFNSWFTIIKTLMRATYWLYLRLTWRCCNFKGGKRRGKIEKRIARSILKFMNIRKGLVAYSPRVERWQCCWINMGTITVIIGRQWNKFTLKYCYMLVVWVGNWIYQIFITRNYRQLYFQTGRSASNTSVHSLDWNLPRLPSNLFSNLKFRRGVEAETDYVHSLWICSADLCSGLCAQRLGYFSFYCNKILLHAFHSAHNSFSARNVWLIHALASVSQRLFLNPLRAIGNNMYQPDLHSAYMRVLHVCVPDCFPKRH